MKVVRLRGSAEGRLGRLSGDEVHLFPEGCSLVEAITADESAAVATVPAASEFAAPTHGLVSLRDCVGFLDHIRNARRARGVTDPLADVWHQRPAFYFANPASVRSATDPIEIPAGCERFDYEFEVGAVLARGGRDLTVDEASACIAGYVLYCDWSARDIQNEERLMQIGQGKAKDAAISLGPWVLAGEEAVSHRVADGFDFDVSIQVNGETVHAGPFRGMDWSFEELVAYASLGSELHPGDIVASGTLPWGCLMEHSGRQGFRGWLQPGDVVRLDGGPLGVIESSITAPPPMPAWRRSAASSL